MIDDYAVAFFDILGFRSKFMELGLSAIVDKYRALIQVIDETNSHASLLFGEQKFTESVYWTQDGDVFPVVRIYGAYASDSIVIWSHAAWPEARGRTEVERNLLSKDPCLGWQYQVVPCDTFLGVCCEIICRGLELGLPLRGSLSMGKAILDSQNRIFLGVPLIEAVELEKGQNFVGAGYCPSFMTQTIPKRFFLPFDGHLKDGYAESFGGYILDWPRHWRKTRKNSIHELISALRNDAGSAAKYFDNTISTVAMSDACQSNFESMPDISIRAVYPAFSSPDLKAKARAVRTRKK